MSDEKGYYDSLVLRVARGDRSALEAVYEGLKSQVYGLALAVLKNRCDAEDVMQNAFLRVWDAAPQYRGGTDAKAWIMKITRNLALEKCRKLSRMTDIAPVEDVLEGEDQILPALDRIVLRRMLTLLDRDQRQIVMLYSVCGYSQKEIAGILGRPYATVRWKFSSAMKKLQAMMEKEDCYGYET